MDVFNKINENRIARFALTSLGMIGLCCCLVVTTSPVLGAEPKNPVVHDWPQFLGPNRDGVSAETGLLKTWPVGGPKEVWRVPGGVGMSGLAISDGTLYTMVQKNSKQFVIALAAQDGTSRWEMPVATAYQNSMGPGPRATPTVVGKSLYTFSGEGILTALRARDGSILWSHNLVKDQGGKPADYGMACSPLVVGKHVITTIGAPNSTLVAFDRESGKLAWKAGRDDAAGYSSPALLKIGGRQQVVAFTGAAALGIAPRTGDILWEYPYVTDYNCNIATPLAFGEQLFLSAAENHGSVMLSLTPSGKSFTVGEAWKSQGPRSVLRNEWQTSILLDGYLYGFDNVGSAGPVTHLTCIDAATGKRMWQKRRFGKGNMIAGDGKLFVSTMQGELVILRANPKAFEELGRAKVIETTRQAPALAGGLLYLRDGREVVCFDVREK